MRTRAAVFLDRDGVLNDSLVVDGRPHSPRTLADVRIDPTVIAACRQLRGAGLRLIGVSNQPDVARGSLSEETAAAINEHVERTVGLDALLVCPHDDPDGCDCRKPLPGLLLRGAAMFGVDLGASVMVGDRWRDVEAGRRAGCRTVFIDHSYDERAPELPDHVASSLDAAVPFVLAMTATSVTSHTVLAPVDVAALKVAIFADGADRAGVLELAKNPLIKGFTTNPTLMHAAGVNDYHRFAEELVTAVPTMPISFEVFADDVDGMTRQARVIAGWGENIYIKIPVTDTKGTPTESVIRTLVDEGVKLNVTAVFTPTQVRWVSAALGDAAPSFISVFAGRIADSGRDPLPIMREALEIMAGSPRQQLIWASPREILNVVQADEIGCHVITVTHDLLKKLSSLGKDLDRFSLETVRMFHDDAVRAGLTL